MKKICVIVAGMCLVLAGCTEEKVPKLLEPVGETTDSAIVSRGEMYNISSYDSAVTSEYKEIKLSSDAIIKYANVQMGDTVTAGQTIMTLDTESSGKQDADIDTRIARLETENAYLNEIEGYDIQILEYELKMMEETDGSNTDIHKKKGEINEKKSKLEKKKVEQQKEIAQLQLSKTEGTAGLENDVISPWDGTVVYMDTGNGTEALEAGKVVAVIARADSKILFGDYIDVAEVENAEKIYARIDGKEYDVTNVPYSSYELNQRLFLKLPLYTTFYIEDAPEITYGMYASIVVISDYKEDALQIPENALLSDEEGYYVYKKEGEEYVRCLVRTGHMTDTAVEIVDGLKEGDEVYVKP